MFEYELGVVLVLAGPGADIADLDLPLLVEEDISGLYITYFAANFLEYRSGRSESIEQVP